MTDRSAAEMLGGGFHVDERETLRTAEVLEAGMTPQHGLRTAERTAALVGEDGPVTVERTVSWLEMTHQSRLVPSPDVAGIRMEAWKGDLATLRSVHDEIATPHRWPSLVWSPQHWAERLADPRVRWFALTASGHQAGLVEIEAHPQGQVEITIFGLRPSFQGRGLGGISLTMATNAAWDMQPGDQGRVRRVFLHTSTRDGVRALANYLKRGFVVYATETKTEMVVPADGA